MHHTCAKPSAAAGTSSAAERSCGMFMAGLVMELRR